MHYDVSITLSKEYLINSHILLQNFGLAFYSAATAKKFCEN